MNLGEYSYRGPLKKYYFSPHYLPRFNEIDSYGVMWNGHYVNYFETARIEFYRFFGLDIEEMRKRNIILPIKSYTVDIHLPLLLDESFQVLVRPLNFFHNLMEFHHLLISQGKVKATCKLKTYVLVQGLPTIHAPADVAEKMYKIFDNFQIDPV